jgi:hypothetical protein
MAKVPSCQDYGNEQGAGRSADGKSANANAPKQCPYCHRQEDKNLGRVHDDVV